MTQLDFAQELEPHFHAPGSPDPADANSSGGDYDDERLFPVALTLALSRPQVMSSTRERLVESVCSLLERGVGQVLEYNEGHPDFPLPAVRFVVQREMLHLTTRPCRSCSGLGHEALDLVCLFQDESAE